MNGFWSVLLKEFMHLRRDRTTLVIALLLQLGIGWIDHLTAKVIAGFAVQQELIDLLGKVHLGQGDDDAIGPRSHV